MASITREELANALDIVKSAMQTIKWSHALPDDVIRKLAPIMPMLDKSINDYYDYCVQRIKNSANYNNYFIDGSDEVYGKYNSVMGFGGYGMPMGGYGQPMGQMNYGYGMPMGQQPQMNYQTANPSVNPMYAPTGSMPQQQPQMGYSMPVDQNNQQPMGQPNFGYGMPQQQPQMNYGYGQPQMGYGMPQQQNQMNGQPQMGQPNFGYAQPQQQQQAQQPTTQQTPQQAPQTEVKKEEVTL
jgi:hypothetical protein